MAKHVVFITPTIVSTAVEAQQLLITVFKYNFQALTVMGTQHPATETAEVAAIETVTSPRALIAFKGSAES